MTTKILVSKWLQWFWFWWRKWIYAVFDDDNDTDNVDVDHRYGKSSTRRNWRLATDCRHFEYLFKLYCEYLFELNCEYLFELNCEYLFKIRITKIHVQKILGGWLHVMMRWWDENDDDQYGHHHYYDDQYEDHAWFVHPRDRQRRCQRIIWTKYQGTPLRR